nr:MAG TPA: major capsid protein [Caudoviricetes sp.]
MKKSVELKKELETLRNEITSLKDSGKIEEAHAKLNSLKDLENRIKEAETEEALTVMNKGDKVPLGTKEKMNVNRIYNRVLLGKSITEEEKQFLNAAGTPGQVESTDGKGGYLVPVEQFETIKELRRNLVALKEYCNVLPVHSQHRGRVFLPFIDNDPKTAEIMAKVILFAQDEKIKDVFILEQIK